MSLSGVGVPTRPRGRITITTSWVGKAQVYYSILGLQLASATETARLAGFFSSCFRKGYVCRMWEGTGRKTCDQRWKTYAEAAGPRQTSCAKLVCLTHRRCYRLRPAGMICR